MVDNLNEKLAVLAALMQKEGEERLREQNLGCEANIANAATHVHFGLKYARINDKTSGRLMVDVATGEVFGIKAYGKIHRGHRYGTLDTIHEWYWGNYYPQKKKVAAGGVS